MFHPKIAFEAPCSGAHCSVESVHNNILHLCLYQCRNTILFECVPVIWLLGLESTADGRLLMVHCRTKTGAEPGRHKRYVLFDKSIHFGNSTSINVCCNDAVLCSSVKFFSKFNYYYFGYFDSTKLFFGNKNEYFLG